jgi:hypothetical protein
MVAEAGIGFKPASDAARGLCSPRVAFARPTIVRVVNRLSAARGTG